MTAKLNASTPLIEQALATFPQTLQAVASDTTNLRILLTRVSALGSHGQGAARPQPVQPAHRLRRAAPDPGRAGGERLASWCRTFNSLIAFGKLFDRAAPGDYINLDATLQLAWGMPAQIAHRNTASPSSDDADDDAAERGSEVKKNMVLSQIVVFGVISIVIVSYTLFNLLGVRLTNQPYSLTVQLPTGGGIFGGAEVAYRGVEVGRVSSVHLRPDGVTLGLKIDHGTQIPRNSVAHIYDLSAVGEQYVDLVPSVTEHRSAARRGRHPGQPDDDAAEDGDRALRPAAVRQLHQPARPERHRLRRAPPRSPVPARSSRR